MQELTQERLKELLDYDPDTGVFVWKVRRGGTIVAGSVAGCLHSSGYMHTKVDHKNYKMHRLAFLFMEGSFPPDQVDHINHDRADNRWENLRPVTNQENKRHTSMRIDNTSGVTGVCREGRKWKVRIQVGEKRIYLGTTSDKDEAIRWRKEAEVKHGFSPYYGQPKEAFARLNISDVTYTEEYAND